MLPLLLLSPLLPQFPLIMQRKKITKKLVSTDAMSRFFRPVSKQQAQAAADAEMDASAKAAKSPENRLKQSLKRAADNWAAVQKQGSSHKKKQKPRKRSGRPLQLFKKRGRPKLPKNVCKTMGTNGKVVPIAMYDTVWSSLQYEASTVASTAYSPAWKSLGYKMSNKRTDFLLPHRGELSGIIPTTTGMGKLQQNASRKTKKAKKEKDGGKKKSPWAPEAKQMVVEAVEKLTTDYDNPAYTDAVRHLRAEFPSVFANTAAGRSARSP